MTERWACPACAHRFEHLSELIAHVEDRHPADNVTLLQPQGHAPGAIAPEEPTVAADLPGLEPFPDFRSAAHAVAQELQRGPERRRSALLLRLLGTVLAAEGRGGDLAEDDDRAIDADEDPVVDLSTGLGNRRAWLDALAIEEDRCRRHGVGASVIVVGLADDDMEPMGEVARLVARFTRAHDTVAMVRNNALGVLAVHCSEADASVIAERMLESIDLERLAARVGVASRGIRRDLYGAWELAEQRLRSHSGGPPPPGAATGS